MARLLLLLLLAPLFAHAQTNILTTNPVAEQILLGNYDPANYAASAVVTDPVAIAAGLSARISPDSLKDYILKMSTFKTRNSDSDTLSPVTGIGAARRWVHRKFEDFAQQNEDRLVVTYLQFNHQTNCGSGQYRNIMAILPGSNPSENGVVLIEGHLDSRCDVLCDTSCVAEGIEDNASGTALVMELARVMSAYTFENTLVFMATIGEEQGLFGAEAFAIFCQQKNIPIRAVLNNDIVGGIACGETSSPPSCPGLNHIDSTSVRLFSQGNYNSRNKQLARFIKLQYQENILPQALVPMNLRIMSAEDRLGRGGDHIPFRERNFAAMRFTSANEHGDASNGPTYDDRQHTSDDVLGADTDGDGEVDSFFVDFNYLARNALINANAAAVAARNVPVPPNSFTGTRAGNQLTVHITDPADLGEYRVALRTLSNDWDTVYTLAGDTTGVFTTIPGGIIYLSVAGVDAEGMESLFSSEKQLFPNIVSNSEPGGETERNIRLFPNRPNPFDEATWITFWVNEVPTYQKAFVQIVDLQGKIIEQIPVALKQGLNETLYTHGYGVRGTFAYALIVDDQTVDARQMIFAN
jgi:hypothetical protein